MFNDDCEINVSFLTHTSVCGKVRYFLGFENVCCSWAILILCLQNASLSHLASEMLCVSEVGMPRTISRSNIHSNKLLYTLNILRTRHGPTCNMSYMEDNCQLNLQDGNSIKENHSTYFQTFVVTINMLWIYCKNMPHALVVLSANSDFDICYLVVDLSKFYV